MVKTNQFIKITTRDIQMSSLLLPFHIPIVCMSRDATEQFMGYVMAVKIFAKTGVWVDEPLDPDNEENGLDDWDEDIHARPAGSGPRFNFMILRRDWSLFCGVLAWADARIEDFSWGAKIELQLDPCTDDPWIEVPDHKVSNITEFVEQNQQGLLEPFVRQCRGLEHVRIEGGVQGGVDSKFAAEVVSKVKAPRYGNHHEAIADFREAKKTADKLKEEGDHLAAIEWYESALVKMQCAFNSVRLRPLDSFT
jgi:hypothetical protein